MRKIIVLSIFVFLSLQNHVSGQDIKENRFLDNWSLNINGGASLFWGDIRQYKLYPVTNFESEWNASFGIILSKQINSIFELRGQFIKGNLSGTKRASNIYFNSEFNEYIINATLNFNKLFSRHHPDSKINIYGIGGIGFVDYRSVKKELGSNRYLESRGYSANGSIKEKMTTEAVIPFGLGAKYKIASNFEINFESIWTVANSDDIDLSKGGFDYDILSHTSLGLTYKFRPIQKKKQIIFKEHDDIVEVKKEKVIVQKQEEIKKTIDAITEEPKVVVVKTKSLNYEFKVQVFASNFKSNNSFIKKYNITEAVREDYNGVLYRYSVGSFKTYKEAKEKAIQLINENKIIGAFVVGIKDGKRLDSFKELLTDEEKTILKIAPGSQQK